MNKFAVQVLRTTVIMTGIKATEDEILKGIGFYKDGRQEEIEREMLEAHKSDNWQSKGHALSREMGECLKMAYKSPHRGKIGYWSWEFKPLRILENKQLRLSHADHGSISIERSELRGNLEFGEITGHWDDLPEWKFRLLAKSLMTKFQYKIERQRKYSLRPAPAHQ